MQTVGRPKARGKASDQQPTNCRSLTPVSWAEAWDLLVVDCLASQWTRQAFSSS